MRQRTHPSEALTKIAIFDSQSSILGFSFVNFVFSVVSL